MKTLLLLGGLVLSQVICLGGDKPLENRERLRTAGYVRELAPDGEDLRLTLGEVRQDVGHVAGIFVLARQHEGAVPQLAIQGRLNKSGDFTPNVSLEVSDRQNGNWRIIESSAAEEVDLTLTGAPDVEALFVRVQLDAVQPYVGKFKFCRVTLSTGESDIFPVAKLIEGDVRNAKNQAKRKNEPRDRDSASPTRQPIAMRPSQESIGSVTRSHVEEKTYRRILESKLFVTRADCARLSVRSSFKPECALSVYSRRRHRPATQPSYYVTLTEASKNIFRSVQDKSVMTISVGQQTAKIPTDAAVALKELWGKLLTAANPSDAPPEFSVSGEAMEFSLDALPNPVSVDEIPALAKDETQMLERLRDLLTKYSTAELRERRVLAKKIKKNARDLSNKL